MAWRSAKARAGGGVGWGRRKGGLGPRTRPVAASQETRVSSVGRAVGVGAAACGGGAAHRADAAGPRGRGRGCFPERGAAHLLRVPPGPSRIQALGKRTQPWNSGGPWIPSAELAPPPLLPGEPLPFLFPSQFPYLHLPSEPRVSARSSLMTPGAKVARRKETFGSVSSSSPTPTPAPHPSQIWAPLLLTRTLQSGPGNPPWTSIPSPYTPSSLSSPSPRASLDCTPQAASSPHLCLQLTRT